MLAGGRITVLIVVVANADVDDGVVDDEVTGDDEDIVAAAAAAARPIRAASVMLAIPAKLCVRLWRRRSQLRRNTLPHAIQWYGLMSV